MMEDALELLYTGDLHLGRHPSRIPDDLDGPELSPKAVWLSTVQEAIDQDVDTVVIAGDIVDQENRYFEAYGAFEDGIAQLDEAGIPVVVVAGNHDFDALPEMVDNLDSDTLQFLGREGQWERWTLEQDGEPVAHFDGWSFSAEHVYESPLEEYDLPETDDAPQIGVLHADLDSRGSRYAPVLSSELRDTPADAWLLGHIHSPGIQIDSRPLALYSGSPQPLDPGEQQAHGPWTITIPKNGEVRAEQILLASVRYDQVSVDVSGVEDPQEDPQRKSTSRNFDQGTFDPNSTRDRWNSVWLRVHLTGRTDAHSALVDRHRSMERDLGFRERSVSVRIESIDVDTRPAIDLEDLAEGDNAAAYLADLLLEIENGDTRESYGNMVDDSLAAVRQAHSANAYNPLRRETELRDPDDNDAIEHLEQQARVLLDTLLSQREVTHDQGPDLLRGKSRSSKLLGSKLAASLSTTCAPVSMSFMDRTRQERRRSLSRLNGFCWPEIADERASLVGQLSLNGEDWRVEVDNGRTSYQRDGQEANGPSLPPADQRDRYRLSLHDLLQRDNNNESFVEIIERESAGGYDLSTAYDELGYSDSPSRANRNVVQKAKGAIQELREARDRRFRTTSRAERTLTVTW